MENAHRVGKILEDGLRAVAARFSAIGDVRGLGLMLGSEFVTSEGGPDPAAAVRAQQGAAELGLLLLTCGPFGNVVRMIPPLVVSGEQVVDGLEIWEKAVQQAVGD